MNNQYQGTPKVAVLGNTGGLTPSEIGSEINQLNSVIQVVFEQSMKLRERLSAVVMEAPAAPEREQKPEDVISPLALDIRQNRKSLEGVSETLQKLLDGLRL